MDPRTSVINSLLHKTIGLIPKDGVNVKIKVLEILDLVSCLLVKTELSIFCFWRPKSSKKISFYNSSISIHIGLIINRRSSSLLQRLWACSRIKQILHTLSMLHGKLHTCWKLGQHIIHSRNTDSRIRAFAQMQEASSL